MRDGLLGEVRKSEATKPDDGSSSGALDGNSDLALGSSSPSFLFFIPDDIRCSSPTLTMASREGVNPLRPYYFPQTGLSPALNNTPEAPAPSSAQVFSNSARDLIPDIDYSDYLDSSPSVSDWVRDAINKCIVRYSHVLIGQPFDVAKTILQVYVVPDLTAEQPDRRPITGGRSSSYESESESDDESTYFTSAAPSTPTPSTPRSRTDRHRITDRSGYIRGDTASPAPKHALNLKNPNSLTEVLSQLWSNNGPTSPWKASNATFIYSLLYPTLTTFIRSLLSAIVGLPEEDIASSLAADILTAPSPVVTLILSFISSSLSAILLSPIDTAPLPPLFLRNYLSIDPLLNPSLWNLFSFLSSGLELAVRFPLETVLRRAQVASYTSLSLRQKSSGGSISSASIDASDVETIVPTPRTYRGIIGTMWHIVHEEGVSGTSDTERAHQILGRAPPERRQAKRRQGQGVQGLYRGWRMGMWGIAGIWGASLLGGISGGAEDEVVARDSYGRSSGGRF
ncbi:Mitochondrial fusion protein (Ugo1) [Penicillium chermesinum]|uniref:Mitochondrial fusion protein (Ugo1) n=1 Tax=Penicillium chermesinum TaxID=63820 RepID=A0A9W9TIJ1_9EURO|nr:Mitochondrial fusion protein (Ugo1) [Penicillium chermesinum]KAJ5223774.1 Mitochondrial fusion protein (Ugo1) [Penicillium chermesinum]